MGTIIQTITTTGTTNWVAPFGVTTVQVELWGGGAPGGPATGTASGAGGGSGGQYAKKQVTVTPGSTYAVVVAAAKTAATTVANGNDSTFTTTTVVAKGGISGVAATGATSAGGAGSTTGGVGDTVFAGGNGAAGVSSTSSGGGGSGAGSTGTGNNGSAGTGGAAKASNGGAGGNGVTVANTNNPGGNYGAGGSGGLSSSATDRAGGNGAQGLAILTYDIPATNSFTDDFSTKDTAIWAWAGTSANTSSQLNLPCMFNSTAGISTIGSYDLTGSELIIQFIQTPTGGNTEALMRSISRADGTDFHDIFWSNGLLKFRERVNGVDDITSITFDAGNHLWWRLREAGGSIYWDTSADGNNWTNQRNKTKGAVDITSVQVLLRSGYGGTDVGQQGTALFDNFNLPPAANLSLSPPIRRPNYGVLIQL